MKFRVRDVIGWVGLVAILIALFRLGAARTSWPIAVGTAVIAACAVIVFWRSFTSLSRLGTLLIEGRPKPILRIVGRKLRYTRHDSERASLLLYRAAAESMKGRFEQGLKTLDAISHLQKGDRAVDNKSWVFSLASTRFSCLLFSERIDEAREIFESELATYRDHKMTQTAVSAMEAQLHYCEGEHIRAERIFERLVDDSYASPAARAVFHYFLGRIYADRGDQIRAEPQFTEARRLAPKTWLPAGIDALERAENDR